MDLQQLKKVAFALAMGSALVACDSSNNEIIEEVALSEEVTESSSAEAYSDIVIEESYDFSEDAISNSLEGGRSHFLRLPDCATVTADRESRTLTIDFGGGCMGRDGRERSGKVIISHTGRENLEVGMERTVTFENYSINGNAIKGTLVHTRARNRELGQRENSCSITDFSITFAEDGSVFSISNASRNRLWSRSNDGLIELQLTGNATGINRRGSSYAMSITTPIIRLSSCVEEGRYYPVSGVKSLQVGERPTASIDFGDGNCDDIATVTVGDQSREIQLGQ